MDLNEVRQLLASHFRFGTGPPQPINDHHVCTTELTVLIPKLPQMANCLRFVFPENSHSFFFFGLYGLTCHK